MRDVVWNLIGAANLMFLIALPFIGLGARAYIKGAVQSGFDKELEIVRAEYREAEERLKSKLRVNESEFAAIRDGVIGARSNRQALVEARRLQAVEVLWSAVIELYKWKLAAATFGMVKYDELSKQAAAQAKLRDYARAMAGPELSTRQKAELAREQRPFLSELAWALYSGYESILASAHLMFKMIADDIAEPAKLLDWAKTNTLLKKLLPHQAAAIDEHGFMAATFLIEELEEAILSELRRMLTGNEEDEKNVARAGAILQLVAAQRPTESPTAQGVTLGA